MNQEKELKEIINGDIRRVVGEGLLYRLCDQYFIHYFRQSEQVKQKLKRLISKYNSKTILSHLGPNGYPEEYVHVSLGHSIDHKNLHLMLDNNGDIYPVDQEIGQLCTDPDYCTFKDCCRTSELWTFDAKDVDIELLNKYHSIIFYCWLALNWIQVEGNKSGVVVKTCENNSLTSFYLNDYQFGSHSKFDGIQDWKTAIDKYNRESILNDELFQIVKREYDR